jgi:Flp pilus assembly protein TadD
MTAARIEIGKLLARQGASAEAVKHLEEAFAMRPAGVGILSLIGNIHQSRGNIAPAIDVFEKALTLDPSLTSVMNNLAWLYATCPAQEFRNANRAIELAEHSCQATSFTNPEFMDTCSAAYAAAGQFNKAIEAAQQALTLAEAAGNSTLADAIRGRLVQFQSGKAHRDSKSRPRL